MIDAAVKGGARVAVISHMRKVDRRIEVHHAIKVQQEKEAGLEKKINKENEVDPAKAEDVIEVLPVKGAVGWTEAGQEVKVKIPAIVAHPRKEAKKEPAVDHVIGANLVGIEVFHEAETIPEKDPSPGKEAVIRRISHEIDHIQENEVHGNEASLESGAIPQGRLKILRQVYAEDGNPA